MQGGDHVQRPAAKQRIGVRAEPIGAASQERENADGVPVIKAAQESAVACCERRDHERQARLIPQHGSGAQRTRKSVEHRLPRLAQPVLIIGIVDRDERSRPSSTVTFQW